MLNFNNIDFYSFLKKKDPKAFEFLTNLAKISISDPQSDNFEKQYDLGLKKIFKLIDENYRIDLQKFEGDDLRKFAQVDDLVLAGEKMNKKDEKIEPKTPSETFVSKFIQKREYGKNQQRVADENGLNMAVGDFCIVLDSAGCDQDGFPAVFKKRTGERIGNEFHELIGEFEEKEGQKKARAR